MPRNSLCGLIALTSTLYAGLHADQDPSCGEGKRPMRITARHIEANGVGYNQGYTTLEAFFSPLEPWNNEWVPFLDLRGHLFNDGKPAANAGVGLRYLTSSRVWGANAYYDYRDTNRQHYNQISAGLESLGQIWDFRLNGYLPVGDKISPWYRPRFAKFQGHSLYVSRKREFAMRGANAEVGAHVDYFKDVPLYFAAGPYYLEGQGNVAWGGELRAAIDISDYVRLEGNTSYDRAFRWIGQGQLSLNFSFGGKRQVRQCKSSSCCMAMALSDRSLQRVDRNEIIALDHQRKTFQANLPYSFIFVNNLSSSTGTWESPYPTLQLAQANSAPGDVIYVLPGNGSPYDVSSLGANGFKMQQGQSLWGSSVSHAVATPYGMVTVPSLSAEMPTVLSTGTTSVVTMDNRCEVSGMHVVGSGVINGINASFTPIAGTSVEVMIDRNVVESSGAGPVAGISAANSGLGSMQAWIAGNQISSVSATGGGISFGVIANNLNSGSMTFSIADNQISNILSNGGGLSFGVATDNNGGSVTASITDNQFFNIVGGGGGSFGVLVQNNVSGSMTASIAGNKILNAPSLPQVGINVLNSAGAGPLCATLFGNDAEPSIVLFEDPTAGTFTLDSSTGKNTPVPTEVGTITPGNCP